MIDASAECGSGMRAAVIGVGNMGGAAGTYLMEHGIQVIGYDRDPERKTFAFPLAANLDDAVGIADAILCWLPSSAEVEDVVGALPRSADIGSGPRLILDFTTGDPMESINISGAAVKKGYHYIDVGVSGGPRGVSKGNLTIMVGASLGDNALADRLIALLGDEKKVFWFGNPGTGHLVKAICNGVCAANMVIAGEALGVLGAAGLELPLAVGALDSSSGSSAVTAVNYRDIIKGEFRGEFATKLMLKDLAIARGLLDGGSPPVMEFMVAMDRWIREGTALEDGTDFNRIGLRVIEAARRGATGESD